MGPRKPLRNFILFLIALFLIIYLGGSSKSTTFAWSKITYKSSKPIPASRGLCPGLADSAKPALVVSRVEADGDTAWLDSLSDRYHICVYNVDKPVNEKSNALQTPMNKGHEAMTYLTFMIDNYANLPKAGAVFVHGSRFAWHNDHPAYDNLPLLTALDIPKALGNDGYHNLRCDWSLSTCRKDAKPQGSLETSMQATMQPWDRRARSDKELPTALKVLFGKDEGLGRSNVLRSQCCAQFVVARENIQRHSKEEYVALRQWLLYDASEDDKISGRILSYLWHVLFLGGEGDEGVELESLNKRACPTAEECYCRVYGRCGLNCWGPGGCAGQYKLPKDLKLPEDWHIEHSEI